MIKDYRLRRVVSIATEPTFSLDHKGYNDSALDMWWVSPAVRFTVTMRIRRRITLNKHRSDLAAVFAAPSIPVACRD